MAATVHSVRASRMPLLPLEPFPFSLPITHPSPTQADGRPKHCDRAGTLALEHSGET